MGGQREFGVGGGVETPAKASPSSPGPSISVGPPPPAAKSTQEQHVRIHENKGEVHFHVDAEQLKAAVPVAAWYEAWDELSCMPGKTFRYSDEANGTVLTVESALIGGGINQPDTLDAKIRVEKITIGNTFKELSKFTKP